MSCRMKMISCYEDVFNVMACLYATHAKNKLAGRIILVLVLVGISGIKTPVYAPAPRLRDRAHMYSVAEDATTRLMSRETVSLFYLKSQYLNAFISSIKFYNIIHLLLNLKKHFPKQ